MRYRAELRGGSALVSAAGSRHHHDRRDSRLRNGRDRHQGALTGHLVLSTLHTNDAPSTITRLLNMGVEPFLVTASVQLVQAQRLIRKICVNCKQPTETPKDELKVLGATEEEIATATCQRGVGCQVCGGFGLQGSRGASTRSCPLGMP